MKTVLLLVTLFIFCAPTFAQNIKVTIDFESAKAVVDALSKNKISDVELERIALLEGNQTLIKKAAARGATDANTESFKSSLREIIETGKIKGDDIFNWSGTKQNLTEIKMLMARIEREESGLLADVGRIIGDYTPPDLKAEVKARLLVGGYSLGFTIGDDTALNVALQKIGGDFEGLKYLLAHELYHSIQAVGEQQRKKSLTNSKIEPKQNIVNTYILAANLWLEGTATFVGDFTKIKKPLAFSKEQQDEYEKNAARLRLNFALFEALIYRADTDETADGDQLYRIAFTTAFDETSYYVGYRMAQIIEKYDGKKGIASFIGKSPLEFSRRYIEIYKAHPEEKRAIKFSAPIEKILLEMQIWKDKI
ncbi:MAG: DUF5700 domain-containing putative Zn-dependent protease [Pyrinomonadaceae bacterium]